MKGKRKGGKKEKKWGKRENSLILKGGKDIVSPNLYGTTSFWENISLWGG